LGPFHLALLGPFHLTLLDLSLLLVQMHPHNLVPPLAQLDQLNHLILNLLGLLRLNLMDPLGLLHL
tara:strand:- start:162 stop:359 length:198 start_codon:yes stop_codon:yes gene_type:complete